MSKRKFELVKINIQKYDVKLAIKYLESLGYTNTYSIENIESYPNLYGNKYGEIVPSEADIKCKSLIPTKHKFKLIRTSVK